MASPEQISERAEERAASGIDYHIIPEPEVRAVEIELDDARMPGGAKTMIKAAEAAGGWQIRTTYSRGPWLHANGDRYTDICDLVRVRFVDVDNRKTLSASWRRGGNNKWSFETAWDWSPHPREDRALNSKTLKAQVKRELP